jgi:hypothetical protein
MSMKKTITSLLEFDSTVIARFLCELEIIDIEIIARLDRISEFQTATIRTRYVEELISELQRGIDHERTE